MGRNNVEVVLIGASTGGPRAIEKVLKNLPNDINVPILIVQHMPKGFTKSFADRLNKICKIKVVEGAHGLAIEKNVAYIAPGGTHMTVNKRRVIELNEDPLVWGVRPAVDKLFETAAKVFGNRVISVVLTGMGKDGAEGTKKVKELGGITISESEKTAVIYGMPKATYETGAVDYVLPLGDVSDKIINLL